MVLGHGSCAVRLRDVRICLRLGSFLAAAGARQGLPPPALCSLDLAGRNPQLASPIPFAATAASGLQALRINCNVLEADEWWTDVQWKLRCFPRLKVR